MTSKIDHDVSHGPVVDKLDENNIEQPVTTSSEPAHQVTPTASESGVDKKRRLNIGLHEAKAEKSKNLQTEKMENMQTEKMDNTDLASKKSTDIYLNIRLPGGVSLQEKFEPTSTLRMVKDYVDEKQESSIGSYDLAVPYPRKVFSDRGINVFFYYGADFCF